MPATLSESVRSATTSPDGELELSIVMPCLNEARTVGQCVDKAAESLQRMGIRGEVVVADNASEDDSASLAAAPEAARSCQANRSNAG